MQVEPKDDNLQEVQTQGFCRAACIQLLGANAHLPIPLTTFYKPAVSNRSHKLHAHTKDSTAFTDRKETPASLMLCQLHQTFLLHLELARKE